MKSHLIGRFFCLLVGLAFVVSVGCADYTSAERQRYRSYTWRQDAHHLSDDIDWVLAVDVPSMLYEDTFTPYPPDH